jgi:hypothetical protein
MGKPESERLREATELAREATVAANTAAAEIRKALADQRQFFRDELERQFRQAVPAQLQVLADATNQAVDENVAAINRRFDDLIRHLLEANGPDGLGLADIVRLVNNPQFMGRATDMVIMPVSGNDDSAPGTDAPETDATGPPP